MFYNYSKIYEKKAYLGLYETGQSNSDNSSPKNMNKKLNYYKYNRNIS